MSDASAGFTLRRATAEDVHGVKAVQEAAVREGAVGFYEPESIEAWVGAFSIENFPLRVKELSYWVAELPDGRIGGYLSVKIETAETSAMAIFELPEDLARSVKPPLSKVIRAAGKAAGFNALPYVHVLS